MSPKSRQAFEELLSMGVSVKDWGEEDGYAPNTEFVLIWANEDKSEIYADNTGQYVREYVDGDRFINPFGIRQDIHEVLAKYDLATEWANAGQVAVFDGDLGSGTRHSARYVWDANHKRR